MNVKKLHELLGLLIQEGKGELDVFVSKDPEGNAFRKIDEATLDYYFDGEPVHPDDIGTAYDIKEVVEKITIWPQ